MEDVEEELDALEAVYLDECLVKERFPPVLEVFLKPYTADDKTQQFVEATLVISASPQYPANCPNLALKSTKGLDDTHQKDILQQLRTLAESISPEPMLVSICQEAKDLLTAMNVPSGDCSFCQMPLVLRAKDVEEVPFMKLMSCFHCFHSHCFGSWWRWLMQQPPKERAHEIEPYLSDLQPGALTQTREERTECSEAPVTAELEIQCPVCRVPITAYDVAHVQDYLVDDACSPPIATAGDEREVPLLDMMAPSEMERRERFTKLFEAQRVKGGIIEPRKVEVITEGLMLPPPPQPPPCSSPRSKSPATPDADTASATAPQSSAAIAELNKPREEASGSEPLVSQVGPRRSDSRGLPDRRTGTLQGKGGSKRFPPGGERSQGWRGGGHSYRGGGPYRDEERANGKDAFVFEGQGSTDWGEMSGDFVLRGRRGRGGGGNSRSGGRGRRGSGGRGSNGHIAGEVDPGS